MYQIRILTQAQKDFEKLPLQIMNRIKKEIALLQNNPRPHGTIKLTQEEGYRQRVGDYRILYRINDHAKEIFIYRIKHRKEAYR